MPIPGSRSFLDDRDLTLVQTLAEALGITARHAAKQMCLHATDHSTDGNFENASAVGIGGHGIVIDGGVKKYRAI